MRYRAEIDGLRAVAVVPVVLFHAGFSTFSGGFVGVDVFFVISGYLITSLILTEKQAGTFSLINFYERRTRRILPALALVMIVCLPFAWGWLLPSDLRDFSRSLFAVATFTSNILFGLQSGYFDTAAELKPLLHTWSLAIEEQYYLLFPLFILLTWRLGKFWIITLLTFITLASLAAAHFQLFNGPIAEFYALQLRVWELLIGVLVAFYLFKYPEIKGNQILSLLGLTMIVCAIFLFSGEMQFPGLYALVPTLGVALILLFAGQGTLTHKILSNRVFVMLGLLSYSTYLWHQPLFAFARHRAILNQPSTILMLTLAVSSLLLAYFSWRYVEKPFRNRKNFTTAQIFRFGIISSLFFMLAGILGHYDNGHQYRLSTKSIQVLSAQKDGNPRRTECHFGFTAEPEPNVACSLGNSDKVVGALIGDSHADALSFALANAFESKGLGFKSLTYDGCPPIFDIVRTDSNCANQNTSTYDYLIAEPDIQTIIMVARWTLFLEGEGFDNGEGGIETGEGFHVQPAVNGKAFRGEKTTRKSMMADRYKKTILSYLEAGKTVVLVYPIPEVGWDLPRTMAKQMFFDIKNPHPLTTGYGNFMARNQRTINDLDAIGLHKNLHRVRPDKILCDTFEKNRCATQQNGIPIYFDDDHLTNHGAKLIITEISKFLRE